MNDKYCKELTFKEVIRDIKEGETWISNKYNKEIIRSEKGIYIGNADGKGIDYYVGSLYSDETYTLKRKQYSFQEAFEAYENEKIIESCLTNKKYQIWYEGDDYNFKVEEIRNKWYINN